MEGEKLITGEKLQICKQILEARQSELINQVEDHFGMVQSAKDSVGELSSYDNHPADMGTELFERQKDITLNNHAENELEQINEALHAIAAGTYGVCSTCGRDISFERLQAVPATHMCIDHAQQQSVVLDRRPVEEAVYSPNLNPDDAIGVMQTGYDAEDAWQEVSNYGTSETPSDFYGDRDNYNQMYPNIDETVGSVEEIEGFIAADLDGNYTGVTPNHKHYEKTEFDD